MKTALMVVYNHRFDKNIEKIEKIFKGKFSHIYHIVPFYDGNKRNVIPVYESSYYFSGYIAQAYAQIKNENFSHYVFTADDMILNPKLNENNYLQEIGLEEDECFLPYFIEFSKNEGKRWPRFIEAMGYNPEFRQTGAEIKNILPTVAEAKNMFARNNLNNNLSIPKATVIRNLTKFIFRLPTYRIKHIVKKFIKSFVGSTFELDYPMVGSYSDFFIVTDTVMPDFCKYAGAFAATDLFVEVAIPTALAISTDKIKTERETNLKGKAFWGYDIDKMCMMYNFNLTKLLNEYPSTQLYHHPVKLSKWNY